MNARMSYGMSGGRKSSAKGSSVEFSDYREYIPGDDIRRIDWSAYGRLDRLYIKQFMEEKEGVFQIFVDASKSMAFGEPPKTILSPASWQPATRPSASASAPGAVTIGFGECRAEVMPAPEWPR